jgi:hypothetical protein
MPPTFIGVGGLDGFSDEDIDFRHAGVAAELHVCPGAPHGFDAMAASAPVARRAKADQVAWLANQPRASALGQRVWAADLGVERAGPPVRRSYAERSVAVGDRARPRRQLRLRRLPALRCMSSTTLRSSSRRCGSLRRPPAQPHRRRGTRELAPPHCAGCSTLARLCPPLAISPWNPSSPHRPRDSRGRSSTMSLCSSNWNTTPKF